MRILLIEDDKQLCNFIKIQLEDEGYTADICINGGDAFYYLDKQVYSVVILDRMLPEMDGLTILHRMREKNMRTPVIMVTAMNRITDRIDGLDAGADDYLVKPFAPEELFARIRALIRRPSHIERINILTFEDIQLDILKKTLRCFSIGKETGIEAEISKEMKHIAKDDNVTEVELSKKETDLLEYFILNKGQTLTRENLLNGVWGSDSFVEDGNLDNYIYFLRRRLKNVNSRVLIKTIRSVGYFLVV